MEKRLAVMIHNELVNCTVAAQAKTNDPKGVSEIMPSTFEPELSSVTPAPQNASSQRIAVVGAGCTGLRLATLLLRAAGENARSQPLSIVVFEAHSSAGGFLQTQTHPSGLRVEGGAQGVLSSRASFIQTLEDLQLTPSDIIVPRPAPGQATRYVLSPKGQPVPLSGNPFALWRAGLLTPVQWLRALAEIFMRRTSPTPLPEETLYDFISRHFGRAVAENFLLPFCTGIWGGGAEKLLVRHAFPKLYEIDSQHGSLLRTFLVSAIKRAFVGKKKASNDVAWPRGLISFPDGMHELITRMRSHLQTQASHCEVRLATPVHSIAAHPSGKLIINDTEHFDQVFWTPAPWHVPLLKFTDARAQKEWELLQKTPTHNLIVVNICAPRDPLARDGFGVLSRRESDGLLGVLFVHSIYPEHVPAGHISYRVLLGGDRNPEMIHWSEAQLVSYTLNKLYELSLLSKQTHEPQTEVIRWPRAIGVADAGHDERMNGLWRLSALLPGLRFAGIYTKGIGVADALQSAQDAFNEWLSEPRPSL